MICKLKPNLSLDYVNVILRRIVVVSIPINIWTFVKLLLYLELTSIGLMFMYNFSYEVV